MINIQIHENFLNLAICQGNVVETTIKYHFTQNIGIFFK